MILFVDFEASSLSPGGYPIEIGWCFGDGRVESHLIRPAPEWVEWSPQFEAVHGISLAHLHERGELLSIVAARAMEVLYEAVAFSDDPALDQRWLDALLTKGGISMLKHPVLLDVERLYQSEGRKFETASGLPVAEKDGDKRLGPAEERRAAGHMHRAGPAARKLWLIWNELRAAH